jgi:hypothetical protein
MGVEWMGLDSEALDGTVKTVAKESIVALSFECGSAYEVCGLREMLRICLRIGGLLKHLLLFPEGKVEGGGSGGWHHCPRFHSSKSSWRLSRRLFVLQVY